MMKTSTWPCLFLWFCESLPQVACPRRQFVSSELFKCSAKELDTSPYMDFASKVRVLFSVELNEAAREGRCPLNLFTYMLGVRKVLPTNTQDVEGLNSTIQKMAREAPNLHLNMASDRSQLKRGRPISADVCASIDHRVKEAQQHSDYVHRFA